MVISALDGLAMWIACLSAKSPAGVPAWGTRIFLYMNNYDYVLDVFH
jgi:hypothetical protein